MILEEEKVFLEAKLSSATSHADTTLFMKLFLMEDKISLEFSGEKGTVTQ